MNARCAGALLLGAVTVGCGWRTPAFTTPAATEMAGLERRVEGDPTDRRSAAAFVAAALAQGRADQAAAMIARVEAAAGLDPTLLFLRGVIRQQDAAWRGARDDFMTYLTVNPQGVMRDDAMARLDAVMPPARRLDAVDAAQSVGDEPGPGTERLTLVLPFAHDDERVEVPGVAVGVAELLAHDLRSPSRDVDSGAYVRALVDAATTDASERDRPAVALRLASITGADEVVHGRIRSLDNDEIELEVRTLTVVAPGRVRLRSATVSGPFGRLLDESKRISIEAARLLGRPVEPSEVADFNDRVVSSLDALIRYGFGVMAEESGAYVTALSHFSRARLGDPGFTAAVERMERVARVVELSDVPMDEVSEHAVRMGFREATVNAHAATAASWRGVVAPRLGAIERAGYAELLGQDRIGAGTVIEIVVAPPGGTP